MRVFSLMTLVDNFSNTIRHLPWAKSLTYACALVLLTSCKQESVQSFTGPTMGSTYQIKYVAGQKTPGIKHVQADVNEILNSVNRAVSTYQNDSDVSRFNAAQAGTCQPMPNSVIQMFGYANMLNKDSAGAFDITLLPALSLWGFGPSGRKQEPPTTEQLHELRTTTGMQHIRSQADANKTAPTSLCKDSKTTIEFNSIAAGFAVDQISNYLEVQGISQYLVEVTGELRAKGTKPDSTPWRIALEAPISDARVAQRVIALDGLAASTSGDYRDYYEAAGIRYSHTLDPRTLAPVIHKLASVSVIADTAMKADGISTLLMVLGPQQGYEFAVQNDIPALFVISNPSKDTSSDRRTFTVRTSPAFDRTFPVKGNS